MKILKNKKVFIPLIAIILIVTIIGISYAEPLFNNEELVPTSELIYYLDIYYDGVDKDGVKSSDTKVSNVNSGYMLIEDKIPNGLTFGGFVATSDGTIGAVKRDDNTTCVGSVYDDTKEDKTDDGTWNNDHTEYYYHGLHYNDSTKTVSFKVKNLKAGCKITVGIKTIVPSEVDDPDTTNIERKRDFYNFATVREDDITLISNVIHTYMGDIAIKYYNVNYSYVGNVPANAPTPPSSFQHGKDDIVSVALPIEIEGYTFSGWTTTDVNVNNGVFVVPNHDVNFTGSYTEIPKHKVKYVVEGDIPNGYTVPSEKEYYDDNNVIIDNSVVPNYSFSGWTTTDIDLEDDDKVFMMPSHDVTFRGSFTEKKYTVTYNFYNTIVPDNASELLPDVQEYSAGAIVTLPAINNVSNYKFIGWNKENSFVMPSENLTIYGEWEYSNGTFEPIINIEIEDPKEIYNSGDTIKFKITVTNNNDFAIKDVIVKENKAEFISGEGYDVQSNHFARISSLAANDTKTLYATYVVTSNDFNEVNNKVELVGGLVDSHQMLKESSATTTFKVTSSLVVHHYLYDSTTKVYDDEVSEVIFGGTYETSSKDSSQLFDEYRNKYKVVSNSSNTKGVITNSSTEVTYYYGIDMYNISVSVIGGVGTITGSEVVVGGNDSKEDIIIKPSDGYEINKILINGEKIIITDKDEMILDKFKNVREDKDIEVEFVEKIHNVPITSAVRNLYIVAIILLTIPGVYYVYKKYTSKKENGGML